MNEEIVAAEVRPFVLPTGERVDLVALTNMPGWKVLVKMLEAACQVAASKVIQADPTDKEKVLTLQLEARATNAFCALVLRAVQWHANSQKSGHAAQRTIEELMSVVSAA
jgi:hypothetical protein